ncbi:MAG: succinyl-diaminopimelate desuccinylase [Planctomycetota bacterium]|nr:succinyl-diaminopimelate desuccinylase [Planctomycetota bacterium]
MNASPTPLESLALDLLRIPSVIGNEAALATHVARHAAGYHQVIRAGDNLALLPRPLRADAPRLMLLGHLDTVPESGPNEPRLEGDRLYGLGASDMKGADALMLHLADRAVREPARYDLVVVLYAREEGPFDGSGMPEIVAAAPELFAGTTLAVAMEPTDNHLELGCLGTLHAWIRFRGQRAHSARPWQGENAIHRAAPLLTALAALPPRDCVYEGLLFREVCSATMIEYEGARNVIPGGCSVNVNFRFAPDRTRAEAIAWLSAFVHDAVGATAIDAGDVTIEITDLCPAGRVVQANPILESLRAVSPAEVRAKQAWTDVGRLSELGLDALNFGPGSGAQAHQVGEWCSRARLEEARILLEQWLFP